MYYSRTSGDFLARGGDPDNGADSPALMAGLQSRTHDMDLEGERDIGLRVLQGTLDHSQVARTFPVQSNVKSRPPSVMSMRWSWIFFPSGSSLGLTNSVAPNFFAQDSLSGFVSTAMMREAPTTLAVLMTPRPI